MIRSDTIQLGPSTVTEIITPSDPTEQTNQFSHELTD